jgi:putative heme-binding domain-containing protein
MTLHPRFLFGCFTLVLALWCQLSAAQTLEAQLQQQSSQTLAERAKNQGDAARGAVVFFQQHMACSKCHTVHEPQASPLGPDLTKLGKEASDAFLVEAVLSPSKVIRKGFEAITLITTDGKTWNGLLVEQSPEKQVIRNLARNGELTSFPAAEIESTKPHPLSIMPAGQVNQLTSEQQFLDLIRYLMEIRDGGALRARELQPSPTLLTLQLPEYEQHLDHAGLIRSWNADSLKRGAAIYRRVCQNCHGTREEPGSLPTSLRFAEGKFKNGSDPFTLYQTLTRGFGLMAAQTWMVPSQKYDVIHYLRETYLRSHNPSQYVEVTPEYLARLPAGDTRGPEPSKIEPWSAMDYGPSLTHTYQIPGSARNFAYKGIAMRIDPGAGGVSRGGHWMVFDTDTLRMAAGWSAVKKDENFINWRGIQFNGEHQIHPSVAGELLFTNGIGPGWGNPSDASFSDEQRVLGRDGRRYGPLPRSWGRFRGLYHHGLNVVLSYSIGNTNVLEMPRLFTPEDSPPAPLFLRTFHIGPRERELVLQIAEPNSQGELPQMGVAPAETPVTWSSEPGPRRLKIPAGEQPLRFTVWLASSHAKMPRPAAELLIPEAQLDLTTLTKGGPPRWPQKLTTTTAVGAEQGPFATDVLTAPVANPWLAQTRFTGLDFFSDGRLAVCSWDGDVWIVTSEPATAKLHWQRVASGMFQPLGLKIIQDKIHVTCRDQLTVLHDLNADGETDFYECLNNDHQVTEHFHEFAMGLQTDAAGNFYYAKSARHALPAVVPHHGTLLKVSRDGSQTAILANGFRAANGVCLNPDGSFVVTDQEGHWNPKNRINWVTLAADHQPKFYGNMFGYHNMTDSSNAAMEPPLCWITNAFDRSPGELLWVDSQRWGPLHGALLNLSYGYGKVFLVPHEKVAGQHQGGMIELPIPAFPTGVMRGRFHPADGQLYLCGMFAWAGSATQPGGLYRLRATGQPMHLPVELHAKKGALQLTFTEPLAAASVAPENIQIKTWSLKRTAQYGSKHFDETELKLQSVKLSADGKTVTLSADVQPTWCMAISYALKSASGKPVNGLIHNTIHHVGD